MTVKEMGLVIARSPAISNNDSLKINVALSACTQKYTCLH